MYSNRQSNNQEGKLMGIILTLTTLKNEEKFS